MVAMRPYLHFDGTEWEDKRALRREEEKPRICLGSLGDESMERAQSSGAEGQGTMIGRVKIHSS